MPESMQHKLDRVRPPRVQITYDVETGGAIEKKELPLVVGIMADLSGANAPADALKERKFIDLDRDNFGAVMQAVAPSFKSSVANKLQPEGVNVPVELTFSSLDDFSPSSLIKSIPDLAKLMTVRQKLNDLLAKLDGNEALDDVLLDVVSKPEELKQLKASNVEEPANA